MEIVSKSKVYTVEEREFLPSVLEVLETPTNPLGRRIIYCIVAFFLVALGWSVLGRTETVTTAIGKLTPSGYVKVIQSADGGIIEQIFVKDGDKISQGDPIIKFNASEIKTAYVNAQTEYDIQKHELAYYQTFMGLLETSGTMGLSYTPSDKQDLFVDFTSDKKGVYTKRLHSEWQSYVSQMETFDGQEHQHRIDLKAVDHKIENLEKKHQLWTLKYTAEMKLQEKKLSSKYKMQEVQQEGGEITKAIEIEKLVLDSTNAKISNVLHKKDTLQKTTRADVVNGYINSKNAFHKAATNLQLQQKRFDRSVIKSPINGTVEQLQIHSIDGVIQPAQAIATVVPDNTALLAECYILNKDAGFIRTGQTARVKIDSFPFTKYGYLTGTVSFISSDAIAHKTLGDVYKVHIALDKQYLQRKNQDTQIPLTSGMTLATEIKTGNRRIIEYILSPLIKTVDESFKER